MQELILWSGVSGHVPFIRVTLALLLLGRSSRSARYALALCVGQELSAEVRSVNSEAR